MIIHTYDTCIMFYSIHYEQDISRRYPGCFHCQMALKFCPPCGEGWCEEGPGTAQWLGFFQTGVEQLNPHKFFLRTGTSFHKLLIFGWIEYMDSIPTKIKGLIESWNSLHLMILSLALWQQIHSLRRLDTVMIIDFVSWFPTKKVF